MPTGKKLKSKVAEYDVIVIGGGLAGLTLAAVLGCQGLKIACLDREDFSFTQRPEFDGRTTAISYGSHLVLKTAGTWSEIEKKSCAIEDIQILDGPHPLVQQPVLLNFLARDAGNLPFGWIVENKDLRFILAHKLKTLNNVTHLTKAEVIDFAVENNIARAFLKDGTQISAPLIVGADGKHSTVRRFMNVPDHGWSYNQSAIVCCVRHEYPHQHRAIEHFRAEGPFAILPMRDDEQGRPRSSIVWTVHGGDKRFFNCADDVFNLAVTARAPEFYGRMTLANRRSLWPLSLHHAHSYIAPRMILLGEAGHAMHPIAGQGLNISMRDIQSLSDLLLKAGASGTDFGQADILKAYQASRHFDTSLMMMATDNLNRLFSNTIMGLGPVRRLGIQMIERTSIAKKFFMKQAMGIK